jgi:hypothetical protein
MQQDDTFWGGGGRMMITDKICASAWRLCQRYARYPTCNAYVCLDYYGGPVLTADTML